MTTAMRVAQVVPFIAQDGAFGGPVSVALAQSRALAAAGYIVHLYAAWDGRARIECPGVTVHLFRVRRPKRLSLLASPALTLALGRRRRYFDVVHLHFGRDLVSLGAWLAVRALGVRVVLQPHGMLQPDARVAHRLIDAVLTRRALRSAGGLLTLSDRERNDVRAVARVDAQVTPIRNGLEVPVKVDLPRTTPHEVLFLARLHPRKNVLLFAEMARTLIRRGVEAQFCIVGPDEGDLGALRSMIAINGLDPQLRYEGAIGPNASTARLRRAAVYVLPSVGEVFPMTVIEALSTGTAVVLSDDCAIAGELQDAHAACVVSPTAESLTEAVAALLANEATRIKLAERGHSYALEHFGMDPVQNLLGKVYRNAAGRAVMH